MGQAFAASANVCVDLKVDLSSADLRRGGVLLGTPADRMCYRFGMPVKHARHIALSAPLAAWVAEQVARGEYTSASDLVRTAIRLLQERDAARQTAQQPASDLRA